MVDQGFLHFSSLVFSARASVPARLQKVPSAVEKAAVLCASARFLVSICIDLLDEDLDLGTAYQLPWSVE